MPEFNYSENLEVATNLMRLHGGNELWESVDEIVFMKVHTIMMKALETGWEQGYTAAQKDMRKAIGVFE